MKLQPEMFQKIQTGEKTFELRLNDAKRKQIRAGDQIEFLNLADKTMKVRVSVVARRHSSGF